MSLFRSVSYPFYCIPIYRRGFFLVFSPSCKLIYWYSCLFFIILIIIFSYIFPVTYIYFVLVHIVEFFFCVSFPPCLFVVFNISLISTFPIFVFHNTLLRNFDSIPFVSFTFFFLFCNYLSCLFVPFPYFLFCLLKVLLISCIIYKFISSTLFIDLLFFHIVFLFSHRVISIFPICPVYPLYFICYFFIFLSHFNTWYKYIFCSMICLFFVFSSPVFHKVNIYVLICCIYLSFFLLSLLHFLFTFSVCSHSFSLFSLFPLLYLHKWNLKVFPKFEKTINP